MANQIDERVKPFEVKMGKSIASLDSEFGTIRAGRANPHVLDRITVDYYGTPTPLQQVANISVPEARMIQIQPWEASLVKEIEKAIMMSDLGINPSDDGRVIRLVFPELTEDRRKELVKEVKKKAEGAKVAIRNIRRDANDAFKKLAKEDVSEDDFREAIAEIRRLSPKPGNLYAEGGTDTTPYIIPDFRLDYQDGRFTLSLNSYNVPEVRVNRRYMDMIREMVGADGLVREKDKEAIQFVKNKIDSAKWFISAIKQRHDTLMRTMQTILDYQQEYFKDGDKSKLRPMILKDIADRTGLDVSTISRVVNSKYVQIGRESCRERV